MVIDLKLDYSCARDILLALEELISYTQEGTLISSSHVTLPTLCQHQLLSDYKKEDVVYASEKLFEAGFIKARIVEASMGIADIFFFDITYTGHQYLDSVRHPQMWETIKQEFTEKPIEMTFNLIQKVALHRAAQILGFPLE